MEYNVLEVPDAAKRKRQAKVFGFIGIAGCVISWVAMSELIHDLSKDYNKPTLMSLFCSVCYMSGVILYFCFPGREVLKANGKNVVLTSIITSICLLGAGVLYRISLGLTAPAINNTLYQSQCIPIYFLEIIFLNKKFSNYKLLGILVCIGGIVLISLNNGSGGNTTLAGIIVCLASGAVASIYDVAVGVVSDKYFMEKRQDSLLYIGLVGIFQTIYLIPALAICHYTGVEKFVMPNTRQFVLMAVIGILDAIFNGMCILTTALLGPTAYSVGVLLVSPISFVYDVCRGLSFSYFQILGSILVLLGFLVMESKKLVKHTMSARRGSLRSHQSLNQEGIRNSLSE